VVQSAEKPARQVPAIVRGDRCNDGVVREAPTDRCVDQRAGRLAGVRLVQEMLPQPGVQAAAVFPSSAAFAFSTTAANATGSLTAMSASDLRSSSIPAACTPAMNRLYERPFARGAALMRMIQCRRNVPVFA